MSGDYHGYESFKYQIRFGSSKPTREEAMDAVKTLIIIGLVIIHNSELLIDTPKRVV